MIINIRIKPNSSQNKILAINETNWEVWVTAPPTKGLANKMMLELVARKLHLAKGRVSIISGHKGRVKAIETI